jgi:predicted ArsR family transcriptional regulator
MNCNYTIKKHNVTLREILALLSDKKPRTFGEISSWMGISLQKAKAFCWVLQYANAVSISTKPTFFGKISVVSIKEPLTDEYLNIVTA